MATIAEGDRQQAYVGEELRLFRRAVNWKRYWASRARRYVSGDVLEVGAGLGANVPYLYRADLTRWVSVEPDARLCTEFRRQQVEGELPAVCELFQGTLEALPAGETFDTIVYIDVLEHIESDRAEVARAIGRLRAGGHLLVLCPAHHFLFSDFDRAIGHCRRYTKRMYRDLSDRLPSKIEYLDSVGMAASLMNRLVLRQAYPSEAQIGCWDRLMVRASRVIDPLTCRTIGKSILGVWRR